MAAHHRPLVTSVVAGGLLCALWFVPTANASLETDKPADPSVVRTSPDAEPADADEEADEAGADEAGTQPQGAHGPRLAETGSVDTTPYLTGGLAFLVAGAGLVAHSVRRNQARPQP